MRGEKGFALVITLIIAALLVALTTTFIHEVYVETSLNRSFIDGQQASLLADSGVAGGRKLLETFVGDPQKKYTSLLDNWAAPLEIPDERGTLRVEITEENGKFNLNSLAASIASHPMANRLFTALNISTELCDTVVDWTDSDDEGGAETTYYQSLPTPYPAKNAKLDTLEELRMVKGFDEKTMSLLNPFVTVNGDAMTEINVNTAPVEILAAVNEQMTPELAKRIVEHRKTTPITQLSDINNLPGLRSFATDPGIRIIFKGSIYRILSHARVNDTTRTVEAVVRINGLQSTVLYWREL
jgi:general secretion pathway protein K